MVEKSNNVDQAETDVSVEEFVYFDSHLSWLEKEIKENAHPGLIISFMGLLTQIEESNLRHASQKNIQTLYKNFFGRLSRAQSRLELKLGKKLVRRVREKINKMFAPPSVTQHKEPQKRISVHAVRPQKDKKEHKEAKTMLMKQFRAGCKKILKQAKQRDTHKDSVQKGIERDVLALELDAGIPGKRSPEKQKLCKKLRTDLLLLLEEKDNNQEPKKQKRKKKRRKKLHKQGPSKTPGRQTKGSGMSNKSPK
jgi:hypothetical protein